MSTLGKLKNCLTNALSIAFFKEFPPAGRGGAKVNILLSNKSRQVLPEGARETGVFLITSIIIWLR